MDRAYTRGMGLGIDQACDLALGYSGSA
jgi:hypothetical protein